MSIAINLANLANEVSSEGVLATTKVAGGGGGPKITSITVTDSSYTAIDDTAVSLSGGYIKIIGTGFASGCQVLIGTVTATSVSFVSATEVRAQVPATAAGTYVVYLVNQDGGVAIRVNGVTFSATPTWTTAPSLTGAVNAAISIQLAATGAATYSLANGSSLPSGVSLSSGGLLTGTVSGISTETTYNFTVVATDAELQDSPQAFALNISVGEPYFKYNTLLLSANGTNDATNNTFIDSSSNNFAITRSGNTAQGSFSPYGSNWSVYFDGNGDYLSAPYNAATNILSGDFTVECWINHTSAQYDVIASSWGQTGVNATDGWILRTGDNNELAVDWGAFNTNATFISTANNVIQNGIWHHIAFTRSGNTFKVWVDGVSVGTGTSAGTNTAQYKIDIGFYGNGSLGASGQSYFNGYISNLRIVKGTALYTTNFSPPITPLTAVAGTGLLTCADNRFIDKSTNNFAITRAGDARIQRFSPFAPNPGYSTSQIGGSVYFDGSGDYLTTPSNAAFALGTGDFTVECWVYAVSTPSDVGIFESRTDGAGTTENGFTLTAFSSSVIRIYSNGVLIASSGTTYINTWCHVAVVRASGVWTLYINGVSQGTSSAVRNMTNTDCVIGAGRYNSNSTPSAVFPGYISNLRVVKGTAVYTSAFTPPTTPLTTITNTSLLVSATNAGIVDSAMQSNVETVGNTKISTTQSKFGGSSMFFDGNGDYLSIPHSPSVDLGSANFTIEMWTYNTGQAGNFSLFSKSGSYELKTDADRWVWQVPNVNNIFVTGGTLATNTWVHVALVRNGATTTLYLNGNAYTSGSSINTTANTNPLYIGFGATTFTGYIDDFRITRGYVRYTSNFTPPTAAHLTQ